MTLTANSRGWQVPTRKLTPLSQPTGAQGNHTTLVGGTKGRVCISLTGMQDGSVYCTVTDLRRVCYLQGMYVQLLPLV